MPKLWTQTIDEHRRAVRKATLDSTAVLVAERGLTAVTMSEVAERTGIGRATLYKYFPDVGSILLAWHERQISDHLDHLAEVADRANGVSDRLEAVLVAYAKIAQERHGSELAAILHRGQHVARAEQQLHAFIRELVIAARDAGDIRDDVPPAELSSYCLHALGAASSARSGAAVNRLVTMTLDGLAPRH